MNEKRKTEKAAGSDKLYAAPSITLPKGGGAIKGIGEKFTANPVTGTGAMSVPIAVSPGRSGFGPQLSLSYDSGAGNGPFGFGWSLSLPQITRKTDKGLPRYWDAEESDVFVLSGAEDLVPVLVEVADGKWQREELDPREIDGKKYDIQRYRPRIEGLFARIERWINQKDSTDSFWRSISKDNITTWYGKSEKSRIADPHAPTRIFSWLICESYDDKGNAIIYEYEKENTDRVNVFLANERNRSRSANRYIKSIKYGNKTSRLIQPDLRAEEMEWMFEVVFDYLNELNGSEKERFGQYIHLFPPDQDGQVFADAWLDEPATWDIRQDPFSSYRSGFEVRTYRLCHRVLMFHHFEQELGTKDYMVRSTEFAYAPSPIGSFISSVTQAGYIHKDDGKYLRKSLPPLEFTYSQATIDPTIREVDPESLENLPSGVDGTNYQWLDLDSEGLSSIFSEQGDGWYCKRNQSPTKSYFDEDQRKRNAPLFGPLECIARKPNARITPGRAQFLDLAGDGQLDLVMFGGAVSGFYERTVDGDWETFRAFKALPDIDWNDPNLKFIDLTGDGHTDILITEDRAFTWYASLAEEGFDQAKQAFKPFDEEQGPALIFTDGTQSIYSGDLSGDGLSDLVRIRNGEICYWPNLGYGRFGPKVTMDNSPWFDRPELIDQKRIRLADIDGSGTTDILYLHHDRVAIYRNECGNSWGEPEYIHDFPTVDDLTSVVAMDLLGTGTACLVLSSPLPGDCLRSMRYIDLMKEGKPHLLIRSANNLGAETEIHYAPSTFFYLKDKNEGRPWVTRLPFPVHVVERVVTHDRISGNRFVTRNEYHHGYFDGVEREFRGFGMVEQWDTETFVGLQADGQPPAGTNIDASSHVPPVITKTWFHTGVYDEVDEVSQQFAAEYYGAPDKSDPNYQVAFYEFFKKDLLPDTILPPNLPAEEQREACRALKGSMLRQEVYADDTGPGATVDQIQRAKIPYTVTEQNFSVRPLQQRGANRHAVFFTHARESISYHYERNPADPRIQHAITLEVDDFGNVLKEVAIGYGRRPNQSPLTGQDKTRQEKTLITYTESDVTNAIDTDDAYHAPLPAETRTYELTGYTPTGPAKRFQIDDFVESDPDHPERLVHIVESNVDYEKEPTGGKQRRLIECVRTQYRSDDLTRLLPLGTLESLALPGESYTLAFTPGLLAEVFQRAGEPLIPNPAAVLGSKNADGGGYVDLEGDGHWWIPSGRTFYSQDPNDTPAQELAEARTHFFLPKRFQDAFGQSTTVTYDHDLLLLETRDALDNRVTAGERDAHGVITRRTLDYRVLQPWLVCGPNRNGTAEAFDALGMVVGTAVMGKPEENLGDLLADFRANLTEADVLDHLKKPLAGPHSILKKATTRLVYDLFAYQRTKDEPQPQSAVVYTLARETHESDLAPGGQTKIQHSFSYSDGFGREIQKKIQAEPGPVPQRDADGKIIVGADGQPQMSVDDFNPRWVGSGWTIFNNKGKPVRQYEPFFTDIHRFEFEPKIGVSPVLFYDPAERVVATLQPNHTWEKVIFDPWRQETWDVNDTVLIADPNTDADAGDFFGRLANADYLPTWHALRTDPAHAADFAMRYPDSKDRASEVSTAEKAAAHSDTPSVAHFDTLGRTFLTVTHNKVVCPGHERDGKQEALQTRVELDIEGNQRAVRDAVKKAFEAQGNEVEDPLGRIVMRYDYDIAGPEEDEGTQNAIHQISMEAGERWNLFDVAGNPIRAWDSRGFTRRITYDELRRPTGLYVTENGTERLAEKTVYGESQGDAFNHRGQVYQQFDQAGVVTQERYDFKGNLLKSNRQLQPQYKQSIDWKTTQPSGEIFPSSTTFDALNRAIQSVAPHSDQSAGQINVIQPTFNEANLLERIDVWLEHPVEPDGLINPQASLPSPVGVSNIDYDAKGQRQRIDYKNGASTFYAYDPFTFRLVHLLTQRDPTTFPDDCPVPPPADWPGCQVQNLHYSYDPAGNITYIRDDAQQTIFFKNRRVKPSAEYTYDALYRLIQATGREHLGQNNKPIPHSHNDTLRINLPHPGDGQAIGTYTERYVYDEVGNFLKMKHRGSDPVNPGWNRTYAYGETSLIEDGADGALRKQSNRLSRTTVGNGNSVIEPYTHDVHGNMTSMPHLAQMDWDFEDQLHRVGLGDGGTAYYVYDASGERVRKVIEHQNETLKEERIYLGGFEIYRKYNGNGNSLTLERETLHVMDDQQRIALIEIRTHGDNASPAKLIRYQFGNHLGSFNLEMDKNAQVISYEEYSPYGSTVYKATDKNLRAAAKQYRYTGKERDNESGLYYHGARFYVPWLGRWQSIDPAGFVDGFNPYAYVGNSPTNNIDRQGLQSRNYQDENPSSRYINKKKNRVSLSVKSLNSNITLVNFPGSDDPIATMIIPEPRATVLLGPNDPMLPQKISKMTPEELEHYQAKMQMLPEEYAAYFLGKYRKMREELSYQVNEGPIHDKARQLIKKYLKTSSGDPWLAWQKSALQRAKTDFYDRASARAEHFLLRYAMAKESLYGMISELKNFDKQYHKLRKLFCQAGFCKSDRFLAAWETKGFELGKQASLSSNVNKLLSKNSMSEIEREKKAVLFMLQTTNITIDILRKRLFSRQGMILPFVQFQLIRDQLISKAQLMRWIE